VLTEAGENSNAFIYENTQLLESNGIGWFYWGFKKVDAIATIYSVEITPSYKYVIDNWKDSPDADRSIIKKGLMELAENVLTEKSHRQPGYVHAMLDPLFNERPQPFTNHSIPTVNNQVVYAAEFDLGNEGIAFRKPNVTDFLFLADNVTNVNVTRLNGGFTIFGVTFTGGTLDINETTTTGGPVRGTKWNYGWEFRNDGVDIAANDEEEFGYHVTDTEANEWMSYT
jgi:hypothetical protein